MTGSWGTAHDLRALEWAEYSRRELKTDNFRMQVDGIDYMVRCNGYNISLYKKGEKEPSAFMGYDDF